METLHFFLFAAGILISVSSNAENVSVKMNVMDVLAVRLQLNASGAFKIKRGENETVFGLQVGGGNYSSVYASHENIARECNFSYNNGQLADLYFMDTGTQWALFTENWHCTLPIEAPGRATTVDRVMSTMPLSRIEMCNASTFLYKYKKFKENDIIESIYFEE